MNQLIGPGQFWVPKGRLSTFLRISEAGALKTMSKNLIFEISSKHHRRHHGGGRGGGGMGPLPDFLVGILQVGLAFILNWMVRETL